MDAIVYNKNVEEVGRVYLPEELFGVEYDEMLVNEVFKALVHNKRIRTAKTKTRREVRGGGKKPWRQKGTGRARHGSIRSPIFRGGGVTFGPSGGVQKEKKVNKKVRKKAFIMALSEKMRSNEMIFLEATVKESLNRTKTSDQFLKNLFETVSKTSQGGKGKKKAIFVLPNKDGVDTRGLQNLKGIRTSKSNTVSLKQLVDYKFVLILNPEEVINDWKERIT